MKSTHNPKQRYIVGDTGVWINVYDNGQITLNAYDADAQLVELTNRQTGDTAGGFIACRFTPRNDNPRQPVPGRNDIVLGTHIDHSACDHPATPAARAACRKGK